MTRLRTSLTLSGLLTAAVLATSLPAHAQTYRLVAADGTVHFTNTPTDPRYRREGMTPPGASVAPAQVVRATQGAYTDEIVAAADRYGLPERLIRAVIRAESGFNPRAISPKGARGLMQLMPETASVLGVRDAFNPRENIDGGVRHLRGLLERFGNDLPLALAAYNAGESAVQTYRGIPPYQETREYVTRVMEFFGSFAPAPLPVSTFRVVERDGAVIYTNIPPQRGPRVLAAR